MGCQEAKSLVADLEASRLAHQLLTGVGTRLAHSQRVAAQATEVTNLLDGPWRTALVPAAWLHDIGYSPEVARTGFHPLDGARYLRAQGWAEVVCRLVACHSGAIAEARLRGLDGALRDEFAPPPALPLAAITWADLTSSPGGDRWPPQRRLADILDRYPATTVVHQAVSRAAGDLSAAVQLVENMLAESPDVGRGQPGIEGVTDPKTLGGVHVQRGDLGGRNPADLARL